METRMRLAIVLDDLPVPVLQHPVRPFSSRRHAGRTRPAVILPTVPSLLRRPQGCHTRNDHGVDHAIVCGTPSGSAACTPAAARLLVRVPSRRSNQTANRESSMFTTT
jgi:hypothetical protein